MFSNNQSQKSSHVLGPLNTHSCPSLSWTNTRLGTWTPVSCIHSKSKNRNFVFFFSSSSSLSSLLPLFLFFFFLGFMKHRCVSGLPYSWHVGHRTSPPLWSPWLRSDTLPHFWHLLCVWHTDFPPFTPTRWWFSKHSGPLNMRRHWAHRIHEPTSPWLGHAVWWQHLHLFLQEWFLQSSVL